MLCSVIQVAASLQARADKYPGQPIRKVTLEMGTPSSPQTLSMEHLILAQSGMSNTEVLTDQELLDSTNALLVPAAPSSTSKKVTVPSPERQDRALALEDEDGPFVEEVLLLDAGNNPDAMALSQRLKGAGPEPELLPEPKPEPAPEPERGPALKDAFSPPPTSNNESTFKEAPLLGTDSKRDDLSSESDTLGASSAKGPLARTESWAKAKTYAEQVATATASASPKESMTTDDILTQLESTVEQADLKKIRTCCTPVQIACPD
jgi:hypothetical protein